MPLTHVCGRARSLSQSITGLATLWVRLALTAIVSLLGVAALATPALAAPQPHAVGTYAFTTLNDQTDPTFNQLLGINQSGQIAGYFGAGVPGHPNQGYLLSPPYSQANYTNDNVPGSVQTQVTGLNNTGTTVGFWANSNNGEANPNIGFYQVGNHRVHNVMFPTLDYGIVPINQLLGVNDDNVAVGFWTDAQGNNHGYTYTIRHHRFHTVQIPGATSVTAAAINNRGDIAGFETDAQGNQNSFLLNRWGYLTTLAVPGASSTQALGVNDRDEVVGVYTVGGGVMHGFTWTRRGGFQTIDDPNGVGTTTINGVNDQGQLVGFYTDGAGNTDGMLATPQEVI